MRPGICRTGRTTRGRPRSTRWGCRRCSAVIGTTLTAGGMWWNTTLTDTGHHGGGPTVAEARAALTDSDRRLGVVARSGRARGLLERTVIVLTADHGSEAADPSCRGTGTCARRGRRRGAGRGLRRALLLSFLAPGFLRRIRPNRDGVSRRQRPARPVGLEGMQRGRVPGSAKPGCQRSTSPRNGAVAPSWQSTPMAAERDPVDQQVRRRQVELAARARRRGSAGRRAGAASLRSQARVKVKVSSRERRRAAAAGSRAARCGVDVDVVGGRSPRRAARRTTSSPSPSQGQPGQPADRLGQARRAAG